MFGESKERDMCRNFVKSCNRKYVKDLIDGLKSIDKEKGGICDPQFTLRTVHSSVGHIVRIVNDTYVEFSNKKSTVKVLPRIENIVWIVEYIHKMTRAKYLGQRMHVTLISGAGGVRVNDNNFERDYGQGKCAARIGSGARVISVRHK